MLPFVLENFLVWNFLSSDYLLAFAIKEPGSTGSAAPLSKSFLPGSQGQEAAAYVQVCGMAQGPSGHDEFSWSSQGLGKWAPPPLSPVPFPVSVHLLKSSIYKVFLWLNKYTEFNLIFLA